MATETLTRDATESLCRQRIEQVLAELDRLPTLPAVAARVLGLTASSEASVREVVQLIETDPSLAAAMLRLTRRADLGVRQEGMTVARAIGLLGFKTVRNAVLSVQIYELLPRSADNDRAAELRRELWKHSLAVAVVADLLEEHAAARRPGGDAFVCGLLHDIGKLALEARFPKGYARVVDAVERDREAICDAEQAVFGLDHTTAGKRLALRWGLPKPIVECIWLHHQAPAALPTSVTRADLVALTHLANGLVHRQRIGFCPPTDPADIDALTARLGLSGEQLARLLRSLPERMVPYLEIIGLEDSAARHLYAESLAKANRELADLNARVLEANRALEVRASFFDAIESLNAELHEHAGVDEVCAAAAQCVSALVQGAPALALVADEAVSDVAAAHTVGAGRPATAPAVTLPSELRQALVQAAHAGTIAPSPANESLRELWRRYTGGPAVAPLWMVSLARNDSVVVLLFAAEGEPVERLAGARTEWQAIGIAILLSATWARAKRASERTNEELLDLHRRFRAAEGESVRTRSVAMVGEMAAGAAHELNTPLAVISGRAQMLLQEESDPGRERALKIIVEQTQTAAAIVTDLMNFAKPDHPQPVLQRVGEVLETLCQHWRTQGSLAPGQLRRTAADPDAVVYCDPRQLREILDALVRNALDFTTPERRSVEVNSPSRSSDETVRFIVRDNGAGMAPEVLEHAVDPFFSHRTAGRGRGLGLSRAFRLAEFNGGRLWLDSTPQAGTTVTVELPAAPPHNHLQPH
ncbi:MAG: HDOD domain-containing protein [Planctomycetes bacterium]|nr:HDOD domain-containing protein [Planctomycetota bacterium]